MVICYKAGGKVLSPAIFLIELEQILLEHIKRGEKCLIGVSAREEVTTRLGKIHELSAEGSDKWRESLIQLNSDHTKTMWNLQLGGGYCATELDHLMINLEGTIKDYSPNVDEEGQNVDYYNRQYSKVVSFGERLSSTLVHYKLCSLRFRCARLDARKVVTTEGNEFRNASVDLPKTEAKCRKAIMKLFETNDVVIFEGFISRNLDGVTTTLGREGSDYSAALMGIFSDAEELIFLKDMDNIPGGIYTKDPKGPERESAELLSITTYDRVLEIIANEEHSVLHSKSVKLCAKEGKPMFVKDPYSKEVGTVIAASEVLALGALKSYMRRREIVTA